MYATSCDASRKLLFAISWIAMATYSNAQGVQLDIGDVNTGPFGPATTSVSIPAGDYNYYRLSADWSSITGAPQSDLVAWALRDEFGTQFFATGFPGPNAPGFPNNDPVQLVWEGFLAAPLNGPEDLVFEAIQTDAFPANESLWSNTALELSQREIDGPPQLFAEYTGTIVSVKDPVGITRDQFNIGDSVSGKFGYFPTPGDVLPPPVGVDPSVLMNYAFFPPLDVSGGITGFQAELGQVPIDARNSGFAIVEVSNDNPQPNELLQLPVGDQVRFYQTVPYPDSFLGASFDATDPLYLDPAIATPSLPFFQLSFADALGTALPSTAVPNSLPQVDSFSTAEGSLWIFDGNDSNPDSAPLVEVRFRVDELQVVPEPAAALLLICCSAFGATARCWRHG